MKKFDFALIDCKDREIIEVFALRQTVHNIRVVRQAQNEYLKQLKLLQESITNSFAPLLESTGDIPDADYFDVVDDVAEEFPSPPGTDSLWYS